VRDAACEALGKLVDDKSALVHRARHFAPLQLLAARVHEVYRYMPDLVPCHADVDRTTGAVKSLQFGSLPDEVIIYADDDGLVDFDGRELSPQSALSLAFASLRETMGTDVFVSFLDSLDPGVRDLYDDLMDKKLKSLEG
jgi:hypothetical protein